VLEVASGRARLGRDQEGGTGTPSGHSAAGIQCVTRIPLTESHACPSPDGRGGTVPESVISPDGYGAPNG